MEDIMWLLDWLTKQWESQPGILQIPSWMYRSIRGFKGRAAQIIGIGIWLALIVAIYLVIRPWIKNEYKLHG